jgi:glycosyltransferase involved in cell wall biosynthesis
MTLVSIILPTFNRAQLLKRAIDSVLRQSHENWELIIVDDGSSDGTREMIHEYCNDERIRYFFKANSGAADSRNFGIKNVRGEWITFIDSDDEYHPNKIRLQLETALSRSAELVVCGSVYYKDGVEFKRKIPQNKSNLRHALLTKEKGTGVSTPIYFISADLLRRHRISFDPSLPAFQDWDLLYQLSKVTNYIVVSEHLYFVHFQRTGRVHSMKNVLVAHRLLMNKYYDDFVQDRSAAQVWIGTILTLSIRTNSYESGEFSRALKLLSLSSFLNSLGAGIYQRLKVSLYQIVK